MALLRWRARARLKRRHLMRKSAIGYGRPPKAHQFQPGVSGNPSGRPKHRKSLPEEIRDVLSEVTRVDEGDGDVTKAFAIAKKLVSLAMEGDLRATTAVLSFAADIESHDAADKEGAQDSEFIDNFVDREIRRRNANAKADGSSELVKEG